MLDGSRRTTWTWPPRPTWHLRVEVQIALFPKTIELAALVLQKTPSGKLDCIVRACHSIGAISADDLVPTLILLLFRSNPTRLHSSLQYVLRFFVAPQADESMSADAEYYFTSVMAAMSFVERMGAETFKLDPEEYSRYLIVGCFED